MTAAASRFEGFVALAFPGKGMSDEQFFEFCQLNRDLKIERNATGEIIIMSPTGGQTGIWNARLNGKLFVWNESSRLGVIFDSSTGFKLPNGASYGPDAAWMPHAKWEALSAEEKEKFVPAVPDFIIELRSSSDSLKPIQAKIADFMACGCRLAWLIDPTQQHTTVYRADGSESVVPFAEILTGEEVLPGFAVNLEELLQ